MTMNDNLPDEDGGGFDAEDWTRLTPFVGAVATLDDVQARRAVFALGDTDDPRPIVMDLPQPVIWWDDDGEQAAVAVQAETATAASMASSSLDGPCVTQAACGRFSAQRPCAAVCRWRPSRPAAGPRARARSGRP